MLKVRPLSNQLYIELKDHSAVRAPEIEEKISQIWSNEEKKRGKNLFNGPILSFVNFTQNVIEAKVEDYRSLIAQAHSPHLYDLLKIRPLAVSGFVSVDCQILFGKRALHVTQNPGMWELVPSGGLTPAAFSKGKELAVQEQLFEELREELGLNRSMVNAVIPFLLIEDTLSHVIDIGVEVALSGSRAQIDALSTKRSDEYSEISWVEASQIEDFCLKNQNCGIVDVSIELLKAKKILGPNSKRT